MNEKRKIYVVCGELQVAVMASGPYDAIQKALDGFSTGKCLAGEYFCLDERGLRDDDTAKYHVPVEQALAKAGYFLDSTSHRVFSDGGSSLAEE